MANLIGTHHARTISQFAELTPGTVKIRYSGYFNVNIRPIATHEPIKRVVTTSTAQFIGSEHIQTCLDNVTTRPDLFHVVHEHVESVLDHITSIQLKQTTSYELFKLDARIIVSGGHHSW